MKIFLKLNFVLIIFFMVLCCSESPNDNNTTDDQQFCYGTDRNFNDTQGDASEEYIDLTELKITIGSDSVGASVTLSNLPSTLTFDPVALPDNYINYEWAVKFDMDGNGADSKGDIVFSVENYKFSGENERESEILSATQQNIWKYTSNYSATAISDLTVKISGNTFIMYTSTSADSSLSNINTSTPVKFEAMHLSDDTTITYDYYPNSTLYENISINKIWISKDNVLFKVIEP